MLWIGLQYVIVVFPDHTYFSKFENIKEKNNNIKETDILAKYLTSAISPVFFY